MKVNDKQPQRRYEGKKVGEKSRTHGVLSIGVQWKPPKNVGHKKADPFHDVSLKTRDMLRLSRRAAFGSD